MNTHLTWRLALAASVAALCSAWSANVSFAQVAPPDSDRVWETITDHHGVTINSPVSFSIPEDPAEPGTFTFTVPALTIDFVELTGGLSDRFHFDPFDVHITSDGDPGGLFLRTGTTVIPESALESFTPVKIFAHSDGDGPNQTTTGSDHFQVFALGPLGLAPIVDVIMAETPVFPDGPDVPPIVPFTTPRLMYDVLEPGTPGQVSDWLDIEPITGYFVSSDDPSAYPPLDGPVHGVIVEDGVASDPFYGGDLNFALHFASDTEVPEPASLLLLGLGCLGLASIGRRRGCHLRCA